MSRGKSKRGTRERRVKRFSFDIETRAWPLGDYHVGMIIEDKFTAVKRTDNAQLKAYAAGIDHAMIIHGGDLQLKAYTAGYFSGLKNDLIRDVISKVGDKVMSLTPAEIGTHVHEELERTPCPKSK